MNAPHEHASNKGQRANVGHIPKTKRGDYDVEIVSTNVIEGGVEAFVRAWDDNKPVGFVDGTVEIERFHIYNPPMLVADPNGDIVRQSTNSRGETLTRKYREDPQEALLQVIEHNLSVMHLFSQENIQLGKVGHTTSTFFPAAGAASPVDGWTHRASVDETFSTIRTSAGSDALDTAVNDELAYLLASGTSNQFARMRRSVYGFATSTIGSDTISSATLSIYGSNRNTGLGNPNIDIVSATPASASALAASDYNIASYGSTLFATGIAAGSWNTTGYNDYALNASGLAAINTSGNTFFGTRLSWDVSNSFGGAWGSGLRGGVEGYWADQSGTTNDPKLVVEHTAVSAGTGRLMMMGMGR